MHLTLVALVVAEYDPAIAFFTDVLGFDRRTSGWRRPESSS
jgi:hypothetical protein